MEPGPGRLGAALLVERPRAPGGADLVRARQLALGDARLHVLQEREAFGLLLADRATQPAGLGLRLRVPLRVLRLRWAIDRRRPREEGPEWGGIAVRLEGRGGDVRRIPHEDPR